MKTLLLSLVMIVNLPGDCAVVTPYEAAVQANVHIYGSK